jgi:hypothetical protein
MNLRITTTLHMRYDPAPPEQIAKKSGSCPFENPPMDDLRECRGGTPADYHLADRPSSNHDCTCN